MKQLDKSIAPALQNGLTVLELLATNGKEVGFNAIAAHIGVSKATTSRLLNVLRQRHYVVKDEKTGKYRPGPRMSFLNNSLPMIEVLRCEIPSVLTSLMDATGNTCLFIFWNGQELQCLNKKTHQGSVPMQDIGHVDSDLTAGPWGWFAYNSLDNAGRKKAELTMTAHPAYKQIYPRWKNFFDKHNFCYDDQELYPPLRRLAVAIYDKSGNLLGTLAVGGNSLTIKDNQVLKLGEILIEHAERLMERI
jgi:IclR family transcriptional regulator, KDG regulon repressor